LFCDDQNLGLRQDNVSSKQFLCVTGQSKNTLDSTRRRGCDDGVRSEGLGVRKELGLLLL